MNDKHETKNKACFSVYHYERAVRFIIFLLQSSLDRVETGKDFVCRVFLKLISQLHQEQVINELLGNGDKTNELGHSSDEPSPIIASASKKKNKRKNKK